MVTGFLIFLGSIVLLALDIKLVMENDNAPGILKFFGGILIFVLVWGNVLSFGYFILPTLMYIPASYACGPIVIIPLVVLYVIVKLTTPR